MNSQRRLSSCLLKCGMILILMVTMSTAELPKTVYLVSNFHPACCGWLADWSTERNYCANTYLDHLDRVRDDANYDFVLSEVPNMIAILNFHQDRVAELKQRIQEGRVELCNAFFLEPTINLSGGEALVKNGIEGLRWQSQVLGFRPRFAWMIDVTGTHEQMAQITAGLGLDALFYTRHNPTGYALHWVESPDGSRVPAISPGHYSEWTSIFRSKEPLSDEQITELVKDVEFRANPVPLSEEAIEKRRNIWSGTPPRAPRGTPVLILGGSGDYSPAPPYKGYPTEFIQRFEALAPGTRFSFATASQYLDSVMPGIKDGSIPLRTMKGSTAFSFNAFWIENPRVKQSFRRCEQGLQAAEMLATAASLRKGMEYPTQPLYHSWLMMLLNMDRNSLWGSAGGMVFESATSWDVKDRYESVQTIYKDVMQKALAAESGTETAIGFFNSLNWTRQDPLLITLPEGKQLKGITCQREPDSDVVIAEPSLKSTAVALFETEDNPALPTRAIELPNSIETKYYRIHIDPETGAIASLKLKGSSREMLGGPANVIVAEKPKIQNGEPGDHIVDRQDRETLTTSSRYKPTITITAGPLATTVRITSDFFGEGKLVRLVRFYNNYPRIDFQTELNDIPDRTVVVAEFPLAEDITEIRRGIPYGFSQAAWSKSNSALQGWSKGILPAVRWSHYSLEQGGGVALLDRGVSGREITGRTPILFLLNAADTYYGYPNAWLSGKGKHVLEYALVAHDSEWAAARIPQLAWEFNDPAFIYSKPAPAKAIGSILTTSDNVIVEAVRREGDEIEVRMAEAFGQNGEAQVRLHLPHSAARLTNLVGQTIQKLNSGESYRFPVRPQQIVTLRFKTEKPVAAIVPLTDWNPLVPAHKRAALNTFIDKKGHPPRGDNK